MATTINGGEKAETAAPDKKFDWSKLTVLSRARSRKLFNSPLKTSTPFLPVGPDTPPDNDHNTARRSIDEPLSPSTPGVNGLRQQLIQSRLESVSPGSIRRFNNEIAVSELDDDLGSVQQNSRDNDNPKMFESMDPCLSRTWAMFSFCVLEPARCLMRPICNDKQQPGPVKANGNDHAAGDGELRWRQRRSRLSTGTVTIVPSRT